MSGAPKRSHEEGAGHSSSSSKYPQLEDSYPKLTSASTAPSEYHHHHPHPHSHHHVLYDLDPRTSKAPRSEPRDGDRRSPLHSVYRVAPTDTHMVHHPSPEARLDPRDFKDVREIRIESRDSRVETREMHGEAKREFKGEKDAKFESRVDDGKETKYDRENHGDQKSETKTEKDGHVPLNWKDPKEYHRGKRFPDVPSGNVEQWQMSRGVSQGPSEAMKEGFVAEDREYVEGHEAVGENRLDMKNEDRFKDKDRKKKDSKHRDWGDRDKDKGERRSEFKEAAREERESERWERERKDQKDRERLKEKEKDPAKRESWIGTDKEGSHNDKDLGEGSFRALELETQALDQKKQKDTDGWRSTDKDPKDRRREREADGDGERAEKRSRCSEKEPDDGSVDGEGAVEREKEIFNYAVQQRKRMLRPRGSPQVNRETRFRSRAPDTEGSQGKSEVSSLVYKVGECMQGLSKLWKEYEASQADKSGDFANKGPTLEVRIPAEHVTATNRQVRGGQLWGTDIYTDDSDLVAVLMHTGYCRPTASPPPPAIQELRATIRVLPPQDCYTSKLRNNVRSRAWGAGIGCSYRVERCCIVKKGGGTIDLEPCLSHSSAVEPTLAPMAVERSMTTRAAASNALRQQRFVREVTIQYNLCNEPWIKYSINIVADKGLKKPIYTSARLKKGEVLYLETHSSRYELCFAGEKMVKATHSSQAHEAENEKSQNHHSHLPNGERADSDNCLIDVYRWSRCKKPLPQKLMRSFGIPLPSDHVEVLEENLEWEDVQWSQTGVWIAGKEYTLARVHFLSMN